MDAEAKIATADYSGAAQNINTIRAKYSEAPVSFTTAADGYSWLLATWGTEKYSQGDRYACLVRWGKAQSMLAAKGWQLTHNLMPVPLNLINNYPNLVQNPGY